MVCGEGRGCGLRIENGPDPADAIAELYEGQELPGVLARLMAGTPWCDEVQEYAPMEDPTRMHPTPKAVIRTYCRI